MSFCRFLLIQLNAGPISARCHLHSWGDTNYISTTTVSPQLLWIWKFFQNWTSKNRRKDILVSHYLGVIIIFMSSCLKTYAPSPPPNFYASGIQDTSIGPGYLKVCTQAEVFKSLQIEPFRGRVSLVVLHYEFAQYISHL
jgi:hypothetical protein